MTGKSGSTVRNSAGKPRRRTVSLGAVAANVLAPLVARRAGMTSQLLAAWRDLIGEPHGLASRPEKIVWPRRTGAEDEFAAGTLVIACDGAHALWLQHETGEVIARVNRFFGFAAIDRVRLVQKPTGKAPAEKPRPVLDTAAQSRLQAVLARVEKPELRAALRGLGEGVYSRRKP